MTKRERFRLWLMSSGFEYLDEDRAMMWAAWQAARRWIPVEEELPEVGGLVLAIDKGGGYWLVYRNNFDMWISLESEGDIEVYLDIICWQPLPQPPEEENEK